MPTRTLLAALVLASTLHALPCSAAEDDGIGPYVQSNANAGVAPFADDRLFRAFHGKAGVDRIVDRMFDAATTDPRIADFYKGADMTRTRRTLKEQLCYILGGPCAYTGRDMKAAHKNIGVQQTDFNILVEHLQAAMRAEGVSYRDQNKLLAKLAPLEREIVER